MESLVSGDTVMGSPPGHQQKHAVLEKGSRTQ